MIVYIAIWTLLLAFSFKKKHISSDMLFWSFLLVLVFIAGGRGIDVGVDTKTYLEVFYNILRAYMEHN